ncbi:class I SAM-dependent methyltransferase [Apilactobacillus xinyiensis]|uniref:class I SAM-dependent methyltransferase n=1 Tax=Apilactobacillus xinyiensis TaxID=2841032 RepID=UPI00200E8188|nr:class I SAM-dependent methyltransferase [Apilactobacillus xinyiensis]MCL0330779.1 class I SAM-dependent methyltransferase [Apilactobacillus xinyiensis]
MHKNFKYKSNNQFVEVVSLISFVVLFITYLATNHKNIYLFWALAFIIFTFLSIFRNYFLRNKLFKEFIANIDVQNSQCIMDLGSDDGFLIIQVANKLPVSSKASIVAIEDVNQFNNQKFKVNAINNRVKYRISLVNGDIRKLAYADNSFDTITAATSLNSYLSSRKKVDYKMICSEINRLLVPGGTAYIFNTNYIAQKMANEFSEQGNSVFMYDYKFQSLYGLRILSVIKK